LHLGLSDGFHCPVGFRDAIESFNEIFVRHEYGPFLDEIPFPKRWLDLGCHCGYFSLYLAWQCRVRGLPEDYRGLLLDGDARVLAEARRTLLENRIEGHFEVLHGVIGSGAGEMEFAQRDGMSSSTNLLDLRAKRVVRVPILPPEAIAAALPPPYDLVKIDIEGGESDFLESYTGLLDGCGTLLLEWHDWNRMGWGEEEIGRRVRALGFRKVRPLKAATEVRAEGQTFRFGVDQYRRE
jgi:FkbM family methyltransferase